MLVKITVDNFHFCLNNVSMDGQKIFGTLLIVGFIFGGIFMLTRSSPDASAHARPRMLTQTSSGLKPFIPTENHETAPLEPKGARRYRNTETREIEWNDKGLPVKITIHRDAIQS